VDDKDDDDIGGDLCEKFVDDAMEATAGEEEEDW